VIDCSRNRHAHLLHLCKQKLPVDRWVISHKQGTASGKDFVSIIHTVTYFKTASKLLSTLFSNNVITSVGNDLKSFDLKS